MQNKWDTMPESMNRCLKIVALIMFLAKPTLSLLTLTLSENLLMKIVHTCATKHTQNPPGFTKVIKAVTGNYFD